MIKIGLTGSIAMGKSFIANAFKYYGCRIIDADKIVATLYKQKKLQKEIKAEFPSVFDENEINKAKLADIVFSNKDKLKKLESIIHPLVKEKIQKELNKQTTEIVVVEVPLLFEQNYTDLFDYTVVVYAPKYIQEKRALARKNMDIAKLKSIMKLQWSTEVKIKKADFAINTAKEKELVYQEIKNLIESITQ